MFDANLFARRWTTDYYQSKHHVFKNSGMPQPVISTAVSTVNELNTVKLLSQGQKYKKAFHVCQTLTSLLSEMPMRQFTSRMEVLEKITMVAEDWHNVF